MQTQVWQNFTFPVFFNPLYTGNPRTGTLAYSKDPDEMPHLVVKWDVSI